MFAAAALVLVAIAYRIFLGLPHGGHFDHWMNFSPFAAIVLCGSIYFPRRIAIAFPMGALLISDLILNAAWKFPLMNGHMLPNYLALGLIAGFGWLLRDNPRIRFILASSIAGSVLFFVITNTGSWIFDPTYAKTIAGWTQALTVGRTDFPVTTLEFFRNTVVSDFTFTLLFIACFAFNSRKGQQAIPAAQPHELAPW